MLNIESIPVHPDIIKDMYKFKSLALDFNILTNGYAILENIYDPKHTAVVRHAGNHTWVLVNCDKLSISKLRGKDINQIVFIDSMLNPDIFISVAIGQAGTGKTTLALAYALDKWFNKDVKKIILSKPAALVGNGRAFGPVPGDIGDKYSPYLSSYEIVLKRLLGANSDSQLELMKAKKDIEYIPIELVRGNEYQDCIFILDEAQNLTWHELKTIISRIGKNSKIIILGDLCQIDIRIDRDKTGLSKLINSKPFQDSVNSSQIELKTQYRSPVAQLIADVDEWIINNE